MFIFTEIYLEKFCDFIMLTAKTGIGSDIGFFKSVPNALLFLAPILNTHSGSVHLYVYLKGHVIHETYEEVAFMTLKNKDWRLFLSKASREIRIISKGQCISICRHLSLVLLQPKTFNMDISIRTLC